MKKETKKKILLRFEKHLSFLYRFIKGNKTSIDRGNFVDMRHVFAAGCEISVRGE